jgi:hypothetical protein
MYEIVYMEEIVFINEKLHKFLRFKNNDIKFNVLVNFILCNYSNHYYSNQNLSFEINNKFKLFLKKNNIYKKDIYSYNEFIDLLQNFILKKKVIHIII